ncbi:MAG: flagellar biosynthesis anti-sigma factor FlgM [Candidatus Hydrogenedentes bacterium]|nr:flagellar biosynthesis anti-sigma factor FlgM [Candidatus Hydrogenedentota bacterium]
MVGVSSIGIYAEPANPRRVNELRTEAERFAAGGDEEPAPVTDGANLGATALILAKASEQDDPVRTERIEQIRKSLEQGTYRVQEVLLKVAARIAKFLQ